MVNIATNAQVRHHPDKIIYIFIANIFYFLVAGYSSKIAFAGSISFITLLLVQIPLIALSFLMAYFYRKRGWNLCFPLLTSLSLVFLGALGPLFILSSASLYVIFNKFTKLRASYKDLFYVSEKYNLTEIIYERLTYGQDNFNPEKLPTIFLDILIYGSEKQKRIAIDRILRHFRPEFSTTLYKALNDKSNSIRVLAASSINRIDAQYMRQNHLLEKKYLDKPDSQENVVDYAAHCEAFSRLAFIDEQRRDHLRDKAIELYEDYHKHHPKNHIVALSLSRLYYLCGQYEEAATALKDYVKNAATHNEEIYRWYLSAIFELQRYDEIRELAANKLLQMRGTSVEYDKILEQIVLWKNGLKTIKVDPEKSYA